MLLRLRYSLFEAFARLAEREVRPVEDLLNEVLGNYGHRLEQEDLEEVYGTASTLTQSMRLARHAADELERSGFHDDEHEEMAHRFVGAGYVELQLAID